MIQLILFPFLFQPTGRAEGESETQDRSILRSDFIPFCSHCSQEVSIFFLLWSTSVTLPRHRFSAKEGAKRVDQARPRTNIQVAHCTGPPIVISNQLAQTLDGKFGDGKSEAHGKYSAKEGVRPNGPARPQTHMQVICFKSYFLENLSLWYSLMAEQREKVKQGTGWQILSLNASTR